MKKTVLAQPIPPVAAAEALGGLDFIKDVGGKVVDWASEKVKPKSESESNKEVETGVLQTRQLYNELANTFKSYGAKNPNFTDPVRLRQFMGLQSEITYNNSEWPKILGAMKNFLDAGYQVALHDPEFVDDVVKYTIDSYTNTGSGQTVVQRLDDLRQRAMNVDKPQDAYIIAVLKNNYALASMLTLMSNLNKFDSETMKTITDLNQMSTQMLGPKSYELLQAQALRKEKARTNFYKLEKSQAMFDLLMPVALAKEQVLQHQLRILTGIVNSDFAHNLVNDPFIKAALVVAYGFTQAAGNLGDKAIGELMRGAK